VLDAELSGSCAGIDRSSVQFLPRTVTSGNLVVNRIVLKVPIVGDKDFDIPPSPSRSAFDAPMDLGTHRSRVVVRRPQASLAVRRLRWR
jgi:hypothetical protein